MKIENSLNPNCSEAVMRIRVSALTKLEKRNLYKELRKAVKKYNYDTNLFEDTIFDIKVFIVDGDMPYNDEDKLKEIINKYPLAEYEYSEP